MVSFQYLDERSKREKAQAAAEAEAIRLDWEQRRAAELQQQRADRSLRETEQERARALAARPAMGISKIVEPLMIQVTSRLDLAQPADLVPSVEITKQRILDRRVYAEQGREMVFDRATAVLDYLSAVGEERTKSLEEMLKNKTRTSTTLDRPNGPSTGDFFNQNVAKRWDESLTRARPVIGQLMEALRSAEREWNKQVSTTASVEKYDLPNFEPVLITVDSVSTSSLGASPKNGQVSRPWRNPYYTRYRYVW